MTSIPFQRSRVALALGGLALALNAGSALGSAFALAEQNVMGLGNAFAGAGATAEDANTVWFNPAGLARLNFTQFEIAVHAITPSAKFTDNGWLGRYQALESKIETINVNPAVSWRATKDFWVGAGVNYQHLKATLTNNVNYSGALAQGYTTLASTGQIPASAVPQLAGATAQLDSFVSNKAEDSGWGWNVGAMYSVGGDANLDDGALRLGLSYRSRIKYHLTGDVSFTNPTPPTLSGALAPFNAAVQAVSANINQNVLFNGGITADLTVPDSASLSYYQKLNQRWDILGDVTWTGWSTIKDITIVRTTGVAFPALVQNYKDTWRWSGGVNYYPNEKLVLRAGVAWDQTPVNSTDMSARLPDGDRTWLAAGVRYKFTREMNFDVGGAYIWVKDPTINNPANPALIPSNGRIAGTYDANVWILSAQMNYRFR